ncbi:DUF4258 domain-containing protein [Desulfoferrobacter suflitae]|uniref:DUF4258 domain-containing protein n=1 Tax=Desulfoferrobacter suflitae TaxID=2865782 RepID=UPI0021649D02|nr:DUF4258 domain-containing protein [Desulfoferrobacter suflitae]MCK8601974.1 DUF4258 domain-containing protein [Desulfoferrobacter suflitae]
MAVRLHPHARERIKERGATEDEVTATLEYGERFPARFGRTGFRRNFRSSAKDTFIVLPSPRPSP